MSSIYSFKRSRAKPLPEGAPELIFTPWNFSQMLPLRCLNSPITVSTIPQTILQVIIPANTWAYFRTLRVYADFSLQRNAPIPIPPTQYQESYTTSGGPVLNRGPAQNILAGSLMTRYFMERIFVLELGGKIYEQNVNYFGTGYVGTNQGIDTRLNIMGAAVYDNTVDNYIIFQLKNNDPTSADIANVHTAQAFIQAPYDLRRLK